MAEYDDGNDVGNVGTSLHVNRRNNVEMSCRMRPRKFMADISATRERSTRPSTDIAAAIARGIARSLYKSKEYLRKTAFHKMPRGCGARVHRSYPIIILIHEKIMTREGITKDEAYLISTINGSRLNRSNSNGILNQTRINKSNVSILKGCDRTQRVAPRT